MTNEEIEAIRKRAEEASPGPWSYQFAIGIEVINAETTIVADDDGVVRYRDAEFIADAREDIPKLLTEIERLRAHAHGILAHYDDAQRRVIDEVVGSGRELTISFHEYLIKSWRDEINGVDKEHGV